MSQLEKAIMRTEENVRRHQTLLESDTLVQKSYAADFSKLRSQQVVKEQGQLLSWLRELKSSREMLAQMQDRRNDIYASGFTEGYNKCLKDVGSKLKEKICSDQAAFVTSTSIDNIINHIMAELKVGE